MSTTSTPISTLDSMLFAWLAEQEAQSQLPLGNSQLTDISPGYLHYITPRISEPMYPFDQRCSSGSALHDPVTGTFDMSRHAVASTATFIDQWSEPTSSSPLLNAPKLATIELPKVPDHGTTHSRTVQSYSSSPFSPEPGLSSQLISFGVLPSVPAPVLEREPSTTPVLRRPIQSQLPTPPLSPNKPLPVYPIPQVETPVATQVALSETFDKNLCQESHGNADWEYHQSRSNVPSHLPPSTERNTHRVAHTTRGANSGTLRASSSSAPVPPTDSTRSSRTPLKAGLRPRRKAKDSLPGYIAPMRVSSRRRQVSPDPIRLRPIDGACPVCGFVPKNSSRTQDLRRHIDAHTSDARGGFVCCGAPVSEMNRHRITNLGDVKECTETGRMMVGGCGTHFRRKDTFLRHLALKGCIGSLQGCRHSRRGAP